MKLMVLQFMGMADISHMLGLPKRGTVMRDGTDIKVFKLCKRMFLGSLC